MDRQQIEEVKSIIEAMTKRDASMFLLGARCAQEFIDNRDAKSYKEIVDTATDRIVLAGEDAESGEEGT